MRVEVRNVDHIKSGIVLTTQDDGSLTVMVTVDKPGYDEPIIMEYAIDPDTCRLMAMVLLAK